MQEIKTCSIKGCNRPHYGKTFCHLHYKRNWLHGDPNIVLTRGGLHSFTWLSLKNSFEDKFIKGNKDDCWPWAASKNVGGYGQIRWKGKRHIASRLSYELYMGEIPEGLMVCHKCDNRECVNPNHLFLGTVQDNLKDMVLKNRSAKGSHHSQAKLNEMDVAEIKRLLKLKLTHKEIAEKFNVGREAVSKINQGIRWGHVA